MTGFLLRHIAALEDALKDARRKQHFERANSLRVQLIEARQDLTSRMRAS